MRKNLVQLESDHPGFADKAYRRRRDEIASIAMGHQAGEPISRIAYTEVEDATWTAVHDKLVDLYPSHACAEYNEAFAMLDLDPEHVPQLVEVNERVKQLSGFRMQPVPGLVAARDFLVALGEGVFCSTQYMRHHSRPHYTPEPDIIHEIIGHAPMLAIPELAALSRVIGAGAERATDGQVDELIRLYWYTVEFGVVRQKGELRAYGAGLLSSPGELEHSLSGQVETRPFDPEVAKELVYPITEYQPLLFEVGSIGEAYERMAEFVSRI